MIPVRRHVHRMAFGHHFLRGALHRRLFVWFGISIAVTAVVASIVFGWAGPGAATYEHARSFLSDQFAASWDDAARREALAQAVARDFDIHVDLVDESGAAIGSYGEPCSRRSIAVPIARGGQELGEVRLCEQHRFRSRILAPFAVVAVLLWGMSGIVAHRLVRPLGELARVAGDIGRGQLRSRVHLGHRDGMEFSVVGQVMNEMASRIEKQLADQRALLATVSHEIRTPLSRMRLLIEFARGKATETTELDQLEREIAEIDTLVSDLLASSRIDFSAVNKTLLDAAEIGKTVLERAGVEPSRLTLPAGAATFSGDATLVVRAVQNLVDNAERHGKGVDQLLVDVPAGYVVFVVEDRGEGLEPGEETRIFEPFYQRETSDGGAGLGLGLALVKRIAEAHGGYVDAKNRKDGRGARVTVAFATGFAVDGAHID
ncbi:MAG TPA: ATP-binding protein [Polyangiaceae bacterium]